MLLSSILQQYQKARKQLLDYWLASVNGCTKMCADCRSSYCCYQLPLCHLMEGVLGAAALLNQGRLSDIDRAFEQGEKQNDLWHKDFDVLSTLSPGTSAKDAAELASTGAQEWYKLKEPCVFLKDGGCSIYDVRPIMCATYYVQERCSRWPGADEVVPALDNSIIVSAVLDLSDKTMAVITGNARASHLPLPFPYAVWLGSRLIAGEQIESYVAFSG